MNNVCTSNLSMGESFDDYDDDAFAKILEKIENGKIFFLVYLNMSEKKNEINHMHALHWQIGHNNITF